MGNLDHEETEIMQILQTRSSKKIHTKRESSRGFGSLLFSSEFGRLKPVIN